MKSPDKVAAISDRTTRLTAACELLEQAEAKATEARALRDMATIVAHLDDGVSPVRLYRDVLGVSRALFNRVKQRAPAERPSIPNAEQAAGKAAKKVAEYEAVADRARHIRDETAIAMMNGAADDGSKVTPVSNADIARLTGLSTARIAQMRTGTR